MIELDKDFDEVWIVTYDGVLLSSGCTLRERVGRLWSMWRSERLEGV